MQFERNQARRRRTMKLVMTVVSAVLLAGSVAFGQGGADISTLERKLQDAQAALSRVETTGSERELKDLEDEVAYLRVKARRGETISARERNDVNDRLDRFLSRVNGQSNTSNSNTRAPREGRYGNSQNSGGRTIPSGSELDVRLQTALSSDSAQVEDRVEATTIVDLYRGDDLIVPAGSVITGYVSSVEEATRTDRKGSLTIQFTKLTVNGRTRDVRAHVIQALESEGIKGEAGRIGAGAGVGAILGGILGGVKGAIAGILIGGGGVIAATEGKDVELPQGTVLRVRFEDTVPPLE
jgi:hypothetical protein